MALPNLLLATSLVVTSVSSFTGPAVQDPSIAPGNTNHQEKRASVRKLAINALAPLLDEVRQIDDLEHRVALAESLVSLLSKSRPEACRKLLSGILDDWVRLRSEARGRVSDADHDVVARKVIQIASRFDPKFAKSLLARYLEDFSQKGSTESSRTKVHLSIAAQLMDENPTLAATIAEKVISAPVTPETLSFLLRMRKKDSTTANRLYSIALMGVRSRGGFDPNEFLLLFSYVFNPSQIPYIMPNGLGMYQLPNRESLSSVSTNSFLAEQFLDTTVLLLLDPGRYAGPDLQPLFGAAGDWFVIKFIEPEVSLYRASLLASVTAQRYVLEARMENRLSDSNASFDRWNSSPRVANSGASDTLETLLKRAEQAASTKKRDQMLYRAAMMAVQLGDYDRAIKIAEDLSLEYRADAKGFLSFGIALALVEKNEVERAARLAEKDENLLRRVYTLTLIAKSLIQQKNANIEQAQVYLSAVEGLIPRLASNQDRVSALTGALQVYSRFDRAQAFRVLQELVMYANRIAAFTGDVVASHMLEIGGFYFDYSLYADFTIEESLQALARLDFNLTLEEIRQLESRNARLRGTVAVCKSVLE